MNSRQSPQPNEPERPDEMGGRGGVAGNSEEGMNECYNIPRLLSEELSTADVIAPESLTDHLFPPLLSRHLLLILFEDIQRKFGHFFQCGPFPFFSFNHAGLSYNVYESALASIMLRLKTFNLSLRAEGARKQDNGGMSCLALGLIVGKILFTTATVSHRSRIPSRIPSPSHTNEKFSEAATRLEGTVSKENNMETEIHEEHTHEIQATPQHRTL
ncbi:hypothetical protein C8R42DRAFT_640297 [Lentinula raphanica]|nr:hypothetical protein C8R42DRAFT_640297 [Lentinula raphanica]